MATRFIAATVKTTDAATGRDVKGWYHNDADGSMTPVLGPALSASPRMAISPPHPSPAPHVVQSGGAPRFIRHKGPPTHAGMPDDDS